MIVLAMFTLNFLHPGIRFRGVSSPLKTGVQHSGSLHGSQDDDINTSAEKAAK